jgi:hypothetical protein
MKPLTYFERFILAQPIPFFNLPALKDDDDKALWDRAWNIGYGCDVTRGDDELRALAMIAGILPASADELYYLKLAGYDV